MNPNSTHTEAPASVTLSVKSPKGFDILFTLRNTNFVDMLADLQNAEAKLFDLGYVAKGGFAQTSAPAQTPKPEIVWDYAILCDACKSPTTIISGVSKKTGKPYKMRKCMKNKQGCEFITFEH